MLGNSKNFIKKEKPIKTGMEVRCYELGYEHGSINTDLHPNPESDAVDAAFCTFKNKWNEEYALGIMDARSADGDRN